MTAIAAGGARADGRPLAFRIALACLAAVLLWRVGALFAYALAVFAYPYQVDFGEGIVWQQMRDMVDGAAYAPLGVYPAIVYHYPPVYHLTTALLAGVTGLDELFSGRLVSFVSTLATAMLAGLLTRRLMPARDPAPVRIGAAAIAGLLFLNCYPVIVWAPLMRVDMLTGALGLAGMIVALRAIERPALIHAAALLFTLSVFTKQISLAAPIATFAVLLLVAPKVAVRGIASGLAMALGAFGLLLWLTDGGFLTHILFYNVNRLAPAILIDVLLPQLRQHMMLMIVAVLGAMACVRDIRRSGLKASAAAATILIFTALKTVMLLGMLKSGSSFNYMIEWFSGLAILGAIGLRPALLLACGQGASRVAMVTAGFAVAALALQLLATPLDLPTQAQARRVAASHAPLVARIAASQRPVISDDMAMLIRAGQPVRWESAITAELGAAGLYDQPGFVRLIRARCFGFFVTDGDRGSAMFDQRYNPPVAAAIAAAYPRKDYSGKFVLHLPADARSTCPLRRWPPTSRTTS